MPEEYYRLISYLKSHVLNVGCARLSVHCHDYMGMAVANSLAAVRAGAQQVEGSINGIGERAGNTALEKVVMALHSQPDFFSGVQTGIRTKELVRTSRLVAAMSGLPVPRSKVVVEGECLCPRVRHSSGRRSEKTEHLRSHGPGGNRLGSYGTAPDQAFRKACREHAPERSGLLRPGDGHVNCSSSGETSASLSMMTTWPPW